MADALSILNYHRVLSEPDEMFPDVPDHQTFDGYMRQLALFFNVLPFAEALARSADGTLPPRAACVTFDDGYADNACVALPILRRHGIPATIFVCSGFLDGGIMFNDRIIESIRQAREGQLDLTHIGLGVHQLGDAMARRRACEALIAGVKYLEPARRDVMAGEIVRACKADLPTDLMMTSTQLRDVFRSGVEIGGHTLSHPILSRVDLGTARREIEGGKQALEDILGQSIRFFAYPNGVPGTDYLPQHVDAVREAGFIAAVSTRHAVATRDCDVFQLPRFAPWDRHPWKFSARLFVSRLKRTKAQAIA